MTDSEKKTRKASEKHPVKVMKLSSFGTSSTVTTAWVDVDTTEYESTADAEKWINTSGENGQRYRVVTVRAEGTFTRTPVTKEVTSFA